MSMESRPVVVRCDAHLGRTTEARRERFSVGSQEQVTSLVHPARPLLERIVDVEQFPEESQDLGRRRRHEEGRERRVITAELRGDRESLAPCKR